MKRIFSFVLLFCCLFAFCTPINAQDSYFYYNDIEKITLFESNIELKQDTEILVEEKIHYYFPIEKHGIYRDIPVSYRVLGGFRRPTIIQMKSIKYYPENDSSSTKTGYEKSLTNGYIRFKIGEEEELISGNYIFELSYTIQNLTNYFDDHDELYQNITGNNWTVPIDKAISTISLPGEITKDICFTGVKGSNESNCTITKLTNYKVEVEANHLGSNEGLTVALAMPKGTLADTRARQRREFFIANAGILLPIPTILGLFFFVKRNNRNKKLTVIPHYDAPKGIYPLLSYKILRTFNTNKAISAEIIRLAITGYIKIEQEGKKKYILHRTEKSDEKLNETQKLLLNGIFEDKDQVNINDLQSSFYKTVASINSALGKEEVESGYMNKKSLNIKNAMFALGVLFVVPGVFLIGLAVQYAFIGWTLGLLLSGIAIIIAAIFIDVRAKKGNSVYYELQGLKMYINTAEKRRIEFHNDPKKYSGVFEKLLPYAMIFGLERKWAKEFEDIYKQPDWYEGDFDTFNTVMLANSISNINNNITSNVAEYSSSGAGSWGSGFSGGSSGGGGGGGGGGSW